MGTLPVSQKNYHQQTSLPNDSLPTFYMSDYSRLGLRVGRLNDALQAVEAKKIAVIRGSEGFEITIDGADQLNEIFELFKQKGIDCEITDTIDQVYQG
ncbi:MAG: hypothetical protein HKO68_04920 [Desulfobacterales bacterium]|nr:hypothetical protein [Desulfobacterales bacterium]